MHSLWKWSTHRGPHWRGRIARQEGFWLHNCLKNHCLQFVLFCSLPLRVYFCLWVAFHKMAVLVASSVFPPKSVRLPRLAAPSVFCQPFCQSMLIWAYQSSGLMPSAPWEVPTRKWMTDAERVTALPAILLLWLLVLCICRKDMILPKKKEKKKGRA